ncbi:MAG: sulfite exporter TauE/SafE family protein [Chthoniobacterales bacterium]
MHWGENVLLLIAAVIAGVMNAIAGGGTLLTFPLLLALGISPIQANATSTVALFLGTGGSIYGFRRKFQDIAPWLKKFVPVSIIGGLLGALLLTRTKEEVFAHLVPFLILFATILFIAQAAVKRFSSAEAKAFSSHRGALFGAVVFQFLVAVYGGYFGAGIGILMLASLGFLGLSDIHQMNALKNILGIFINMTASICFIFAGLVQWPQAVVMMVGALAGYYCGAHFSQKIPQYVVRRIIGLIGLGISGMLFYGRFKARH